MNRANLAMAAAIGLLLTASPVHAELLDLGDVEQKLRIVPCDPGYNGDLTSVEYRVAGINGVWWGRDGSLWTGVDVWRAVVEAWTLKAGVCVPYAWGEFRFQYYYEWRIAPLAVSKAIDLAALGASTDSPGLRAPGASCVLPSALLHSPVADEFAATCAEVLRNVTVAPGVRDIGAP